MIIKIIGLIIVVTLILLLIYGFIEHNRNYNKQPFVSVWKDKNKKGIIYKDITKNMLVSLKEVAKGHNIEIIPYYSTLLGLVRHEGLIPWDDEIQICIDKKYYSILLSLKDELAKRNIGILTHENYIKLYSLDGEKINSVKWNWPFINVFSFEEQKDVILISDTSFKKSDFFPLRSNLFEGIPMSLPNNPDIIIEKLYGKDWQEVCVSSSTNNRNSEVFWKSHKINCKKLNKPNHNLFSNVWVINLDRRPDRWETTRDRLNKININPKRFKAIDAQDPEFMQFYSNLPEPRRKNGEVACYLSHKKLWEHIYNLGIPYALIFEDDIIISPKIGRKDIQEALDESPGFDIIFIGHCCAHPSSLVLREYRFTDVITAPASPQCLHAYIISRSAIENLLSQPDDFNSAIDEITQVWCRSNLCFVSKHEDIEGMKTFGSGIVLQDENIASNIRKFR